MTEPPYPPPPVPPSAGRPTTYAPYAPPAFPPPPYPPPGFLPPPPPRNSAKVVALVIAAAGAVIALLAAVLVPVVLLRDGPVDRDLSAVRSFRDLDPTHVPLGQAVDYPQSPPVGGNHWPVWIECGAYPDELPVESAVHDLEHGAVWLTYREDDVSPSGVAALARLRPANGLLSPYADQDAPVVITAWGRQLALTGPDDPRIALFIATYGDGSTAPEPFASCNGGVDPSDLRKLDGSGDAGSPGQGPVA
ncbi:MAG TPA: DUF3105 domain-containing protein [Nocardioides sp.]|nr:DUF3105 domain-containing protein [Nocardioides sp.]